MKCRLRKCGGFHRIAKYILSTIIVLCVVYPTTRSLNDAIHYTSSSNEPQSSINFKTVRSDNDAPLDEFSNAGAAVKLRLLEPVFRRHIFICVPREQNCVHRPSKQEEASGLLSGFAAIAPVVVSRDTDPNDNCIFWRDGVCIHTDLEVNKKGPCIIWSHGDCIKRDLDAISRGPCISWSKGKCVQRAHSIAAISVRQTTDLDENDSEAKGKSALITVTNDDKLLPITTSIKINLLSSTMNITLAATQCYSCMQSTITGTSHAAGPIRAKDEANAKPEVKARDPPRDDTPPLSQILPPIVLPPPTPVLDARYGQQNVTDSGICTSWSKGGCLHRDLVPNIMTSVEKDLITLIKVLSSPGLTTSSYTLSLTQVEDTPKDAPKNNGQQEPDPECPIPWASLKCLWRTSRKTARVLVIIAFTLIGISLTGMLFFWARKKYLRRTSHLVPLKAAQNKSPHLNTPRPEMTMPTYNEMTLASDMNLPEPQPSTKPATLVDSALPYKEDRYKNLDGSTDGWTKWIHKKIEDDVSNSLN